MRIGLLDDQQSQLRDRLVHHLAEHEHLLVVLPQVRLVQQVHVRPLLPAVLFQIVVVLAVVTLGLLALVGGDVLVVRTLRGMRQPGERGAGNLEIGHVQIGR